MEILLNSELPIFIFISLSGLGKDKANHHQLRTQSTTTTKCYKVPLDNQGSLSGTQPLEKLHQAKHYPRCAECLSVLIM